MIRLKTISAFDQIVKCPNEDDQGNCNEIGAVAVRLGWCPPGFGIPHLDSTKLPRFSHQFSIIFITIIIIFNSIIYQHFFVCNNLGKYFRGWNFPRRWNDLFPSLRPFCNFRSCCTILLCGDAAEIWKFPWWRILPNPCNALHTAFYSHQTFCKT